MADGKPLTETEKLLRDIEGKRETISLEYWELAKKDLDPTERSSRFAYIDQCGKDLREMLKRLWSLRDNEKL